MAKVFSVSYPEEVYQAIQDRAEKDGVKASDVVREAVKMYLRLDPVLIQSARRLAAGFGVKPIDVIQNMAIRGFAQNQARIEVYGTPLPDIAQNLFAWETDAHSRYLVTGDLLYQNLKRNFVQKYEDEREAEIRM